jgi:class 3 adenylate cyclase
VTAAVGRKLAAVLSADVVAYSRLMAEDERATIRTPNGWLELKVHGAW